MQQRSVRDQIFDTCEERAISLTASLQQASHYAISDDEKKAIEVLTGLMTYANAVLQRLNAPWN